MGNAGRSLGRVGQVWLNCHAVPVKMPSDPRRLQSAKRRMASENGSRNPILDNGTRRLVLNAG